MSIFLQTHPGIRSHVEYNMAWNRFDVWLAETSREMDGATALLDVEFTRRPSGNDGSPTPPTMGLSMAEAQALFDALWSSGIRPKDFGNHDPADALSIKDEVIASHKEHIADLRFVSGVGRDLTTPNS